MSKPSEGEWEIVCAVEQFWSENRHFPAITELEKITEISSSDISEILESDYCNKRFEILGIDPKVAPHSPKTKNKTNLSDKQIAVAVTVLNIADRRSLTTKLDALGVLPATYRGWTKNKAFMDFMTKQAEDMFGEAMPLAHNALMGKVMKGDLGAIKLFYEMTGRYDSKSAENPRDFKILVFKLIEVLQKHIKDPTTLQLIANELRVITEDRSQIRGEILSDNNSPIIFS